MRISLSALIGVGLCGLLSATSAHGQPKAAWLFQNATPTLPRKVPADRFDKVRKGMTLGDLVDLLGKAWMHPKSSIQDIHWGCVDGRVLSVWPKQFRRNEICGLSMTRRQRGEKLEVLQVPSVERTLLFHRKVFSSDVWVELAMAPKLIKTKDALLLGPVWIPTLGARSSILWRCEDGRELIVEPASSHQEEIVRVDGGGGPVGRMMMSRAKEGGKENISIPPLSGK